MGKGSKGGGGSGGSKGGGSRGRGLQGRRQEPGRLAVKNGQSVRWRPGQCAAEEVERY